MQDADQQQRGCQPDLSAHHPIRVKAERQPAPERGRLLPGCYDRRRKTLQIGSDPSAKAVIAMQISKPTVLAAIAGLTLLLRHVSIPAWAGLGVTAAWATAARLAGGLLLGLRDA